MFFSELDCKINKKSNFSVTNKRCFFFVWIPETIYLQKKSIFYSLWDLVKLFFFSKGVEKVIQRNIIKKKACRLWEKTTGQYFFSCLKRRQGRNKCDNSTGVCGDLIYVLCMVVSEV